MKTIAMISVLTGLSIFGAASAYADATDISCNEYVYSQETHSPPASCSLGEVYDAGDATIERICSYWDGGVDFYCTVMWTESYMNRCSDGSFVLQQDNLLSDSCPF
ncbi:MAG TPA: hypothetical protein VF713_11090 [Thermoanaerobaculia bacterium]